MMIYYVPASAMTRAIKKRLRQLGLKYEVGNLGELMEENYSQARKHGTLRYRPEHLRLLRGVRENPEVVDIGFEVLEERLRAKGAQLPTAYNERTPYDFDYPKIIGVGVVIAVAMTVVITAAVLWVSNIALMTTLIVVVSVLGAAVFLWAALTRLLIPVTLEDADD